MKDWADRWLEDEWLFVNDMDQTDEWPGCSIHGRIGVHLVCRYCAAKLIRDAMSAGGTMFWRDDPDDVQSS